MKTHLVQNKVVYAGITLWLVAIGLGFWKLNTYTNTPGKSAQAQPFWPQSSHIRPAEGKANLVLFVHPKCACSRATMTELEKLAPYIEEAIKVHVVFLKPAGFKNEDVMGGLWERAHHLPNISLLVDEGEAESHIFGAFTSGQTFLYNPSGRLVFEGGLTPSRGHEGDSDGRRFILSYLNHEGSRGLAQSSVYGCSLETPDKIETGDLSK